MGNSPAAVVTDPTLPPMIPFYAKALWKSKQNAQNEHYIDNMVNVELSKIRVGGAMSRQDNKISAAQVRAARALLDWTQEELAARSGVVRRTIEKVESHDPGVRATSLASIRVSLEAAGITFVADGKVEGVLISLSSSSD